MTNLEMKQEFLILYDKITNFDAPGYEDLEISIFLTKAQEQMVLTHARSLGNKYQEGFEATEMRRKELQELVVGTTITVPSASQANALPNGKFFDLPADCLYAISEEVTIASTDDCLNATRIEVKPTTHDEYAINKNNPFKKPSPRRYVWRLDYSGRKHELITDPTFSVSQYHLRYIKNLTPIIIGTNTVDGAIGPIDCQLHKILHKRIIATAVLIATGVTEPERFQVMSIEQQMGE